MYSNSPWHVVGSHTTAWFMSEHILSVSSMPFYTHGEMRREVCLVIEVSAGCVSVRKAWLCLNQSKAPAPANLAGPEAPPPGCLTYLWLVGPRWRAWRVALEEPHSKTSGSGGYSIVGGWSEGLQGGSTAGGEARETRVSAAGITQVSVEGIAGLRGRGWVAAAGLRG